jgi:uncharacterized protein (TIGR02268 family)
LLRPFAPSFALASLLVGLTTAAQAAPAGRSVVLTGKAGESPLIYVAPGTVTVIMMGAQIQRESVQVEGRARFAIFEVSDAGVTLSPAVALGTGERLALRVTYREGSPASAVFLLTGQAGAVDSLVNVSRPQQTYEACRVELSATRERCEAQAKELEALKARPAALNPAAVALAGFVNEHGIRGEEFDHGCLYARGGELRPARCWGPRWANVERRCAGGEQHRGGAVGARMGRSHARGRGAAPRSRGALRTSNHPPGRRGERGRGSGDARA